MRNAMNIRSLIVGVAMAPLVGGMALAIQTSHPTAKRHEHYGQKWHERLRDDKDRDHDCHRVEPPSPKPEPSPSPSPSPSPKPSQTPKPELSPTPTPSPVIPAPKPAPKPPVPAPKPPVAPTTFPTNDHVGNCTPEDETGQIERLACKWWGQP